MKLINFELDANNHFIAMQYYVLILNRTYLVIAINDELVGIVANGIVSVEGGAGLTRRITTRLAITGDLQNPFGYLKEKYLERSKDLDLVAGNVKSYHRANFRYQLSDISSVTHNPKKKWGMGPYPHDGKIYIEVGGDKREFIPLGNQSGEVISKNLLERVK